MLPSFRKLPTVSRETVLVLHVACLALALWNTTAAAEGAPPVVWHDDYSAARETARLASKPLLVWFVNPAEELASAKFQAAVLNQTAISDRLRGSFVAARVPLAAESSDDAKKGRLIDHEAFAELHGQPGLAIIDFSDGAAPTYACVVSIYPLSRGTISAEHLTVLLDLPAGTLTQRTLIFAVRTHRDQPASATHGMYPLLATEAAAHSGHQAKINLQGHHNWDARFQSINARLPAGHVSYEVCAESWPGQSLLDAAQECVDSWRQSSGHWGQVSRQADYYGYDMQRGTNGVWYATGIFGRRR